MDNILDVLNAHSKIYIFGAASRAKTFKGYVNMLFPELEIIGYLVDDEEKNDSRIAGVPVIHIGRISEEQPVKLQTKVPVMIATKGIFHQRIGALLTDLGFDNVIPVSVDVDNCLRNAYVRKFFAKENREFVKLESIAGGTSQAVIGNRPDACIYMAKSIYDKELETPYIIPKYEKPLQVGAALTDRRLGNDILTDDKGENISERNRQYSEVTGLYWVWKNCYHDIAGLSHYRRHFILPENWIEIMWQKNIDAIVPVPTYVYPSVGDNYKERHAPEDWDFLLQYLREKEKWTYNAAIQVFSGNLFLPSNMFIVRWEVLDELCSWMFPILDAVRVNGGVKEDVYLNRYVGAVSERLVTLFFELHKDKYKIVYADRRFLR